MIITVIMEICYFTYRVSNWQENY